MNNNSLVSGNDPSIKAGSHISFLRGDGVVALDTVREVIWQRTLSESGVALILTEHSWCWVSDVVGVLA